MLILEKILYDNEKSRIAFRYSAQGSAEKFFSNNNYFFAEYNNTAVSAIPEGIAVIPFLGNVLPISWFGGFDVTVKEIDREFYLSTVRIKEKFTEWYPSLKNTAGTLHFGRLTDNFYDGNRSAFLFSGGVDSYATYLRQRNENLWPVTVHGADISLHDSKQWKKIEDHILNNPALPFTKHFVIRSNVREFYTAQVNLLAEGLDWWGKVQHGLSLISLMAPLAFVNHFCRIYIASSFNGQSFSWGSTPEMDEMVRWSGVEVVHDGRELTRMDKIAMISRYRQQGNPVMLRVCYSPLNNLLNCSSCEKCLRTMLSLILCNQDPNEFGFLASEKIYEKLHRLLKKTHHSIAAKVFWKEIEYKIYGDHRQFIFVSEKDEKAALQKIGDRLRELNLVEIQPPDSLTYFRHYLQIRFPKLMKPVIETVRRLKRS